MFSQRRLWFGFCLSLGCSGLVLQATFSDCLFLDLLSHFQDFRAASVVDVGWRQVGEALVVAVAVVVVDEGADLPSEIAGQVVVFQENTVLHGLMPALNLTLGLWMVRSTAHVLHALVVEIFGQIGSDVG